MGIKNAENNYLKITKVDMAKGCVHTNLYESKAIRDAGLTQFQRVVSNVYFPVTLETELSETYLDKNIKDASITAGYLALKTQFAAAEEPWEDEK